MSDKDLNTALDELMSEFDVNKDGRLELEELSHLMSVEDNFMKAFCVSHSSWFLLSCLTLN